METRVKNQYIKRYKYNINISKAIKSDLENWEVALKGYSSLYEESHMKRLVTNTIKKYDKRILNFERKLKKLGH